MSTAGDPQTLGYGAAFLYGLIQGVTEFLPVSSSGHLALAHRMGLGEIPEGQQLPFDVLLHAATLVAIFIAFFRDILASLRQRPFFYVVVAISVVPTGLFGLFGAQWVTWVGQRYWALALCYFYTAFLLVAAERRSRKFAQGTSELGEVSVAQGSWVGILQIFALFPGISRSGSTIAAGLVGGMAPGLAVSYGFLVGLPLIAAAAIKDAADGGFSALVEVVGPGPLATAFLTSLVFGVGSIVLLKRLVQQRRLAWFGVYCALVGFACLALEWA